MGWVKENDKQICWWFVEDFRVQRYVQAIKDLSFLQNLDLASWNAHKLFSNVHLQMV